MAEKAVVKPALDPIVAKALAVVQPIVAGTVETFSKTAKITMADGRILKLQIKAAKDAE